MPAPHAGRQGGEASVRPILFEHRGARLRAYPVLLYAGLLAGVMVGRRAGAGFGLDPDLVTLALLLLVPVGLAGARLLFVLLHWDLYRNDVQRIWRVGEGGASLYGGFLVVTLASIPIVALLRLPAAAFWDAAAVAMLAGLACGRIGCFLNGCCAGRPDSGPFAMRLPDHRGRWRRRLPLQLCEAAYAAGLLLVLVMWATPPFPGAFAVIAIGTYAVLRFGLERLRESSDRVGNLRVHRAISAALFTLSVVLWMLLRPDPPLGITQHGNVVRSRPLRPVASTVPTPPLRVPPPIDAR